MNPRCKPPRSWPLWYCPRCGDKMDPKFRITHERICAMVEYLCGNADDVDQVFP